MYVPPHFKQQDQQAIEQLVREFSFATLVSVKNNLPLATHIPLELEIHNGQWLLHGHMAKANPQWKNFKTQPDVLAIFMGPHSYVSPSWYNHRNVPTWNYMAAHLYGKVKLTTGKALEIKLKNLMVRYENAHAQYPQAYEAIPAETLRADLRAVVGFEITVEKIQASFKLSQNRDAESYASIIEQLKKLKAYDAGRIAAEMEKHKQP